jgi:hypothetical protein
MKTQKMSLANIQGKLSRTEMKSIMAGSGPGDSCNVYCGSGSGYTCSGTCSSCEDAGNGQNPKVPGGDKLCV